MKKNLTVLTCALALVLLTAAIATGCSNSPAIARIIVPPEADSSSAAAQAVKNDAAQPAAAASPDASTAAQPSDTPTSKASPAEPLSRGMEGDEITALQNRLGELGYMDVVTGFYGRTTEQAVADFQADNGVESDGIVGSGTWALLFSAAQ